MDTRPASPVPVRAPRSTSGPHSRWLAMLLTACCVYPSFASDAGHMARSAAALIRATLPTRLSTPQDYISRFVLYVRWPDDAAIKAWQVCVATPATDGDARYAGVSARDRPFSVRHVTTTDAIADCQILDLSGTDAVEAARFLKVAQPMHGILTVGDGSSFCSAGGQICLLLHEPQGGFEVNLSAVKSSGLAINAQLLMLARQHSTEGGTPRKPAAP
jgi:hypothetical protein